MLQTREQDSGFYSQFVTKEYEANTQYIWYSEDPQKTTSKDS